MRQYSIKQAGALLGLDARIALAVFSVISVVVGATIMLNMDSTRAKTLSGELADTGRAIEGLHHDVKIDIFRALTSPSEKNAFAALYDARQITEEDNLRGKWLGPYITFNSTQHPRYGDMLITKNGLEHTTTCETANDCYLWLTYAKVKRSIAEEVNGIIDSPAEPNPDRSGRVQWSGDKDTVVLKYRASKALSAD